MQRLSRSLIRFETQDIKTQPLFNHFLSFISSPKPEIIFGIPLMIDSWLLVYGCGITDELCECHSRVCFEPRLETTFIFINRRLLNSSEGHQQIVETFMSDSQQNFFQIDSQVPVTQKHSRWNGSCSHQKFLSSCGLFFSFLIAISFILFFSSTFCYECNPKRWNPLLFRKSHSKSVFIWALTQNHNRFLSFLLSSSNLLFNLSYLFNFTQILGDDLYSYLLFSLSFLFFSKLIFFFIHLFLLSNYFLF